MKSELNPQDYGPQESGFTTELVQKLIGGFITVEEAIAQKKLFVLDYHDILMQYVEKVRSIKWTTLYGSRTLFFLNSDDTLEPLAIELTRPPMNGKPQWKKVYSPSIDHATDIWLWRLAKAHVLAHDSCVHQLVVHWYVHLYIYISIYSYIQISFEKSIQYIYIYAGLELIVAWSHMQLP